MANQALLDQVSVVTGGARGIGKEICLHLGQAGSKILLNDLGEKEANETAEWLSSKNIEVDICLGDVSSQEDAQKMAKQAHDKWGRLDILVNNAGITRDSMFHKLTLEKWDEVIRVNLTGTFNVTQACARFMMEQKSGRIINLSSIAWLGNIGQTNYSASKAGVVGMTRSWALELARKGITCNAIAPGLIDTILTQQIPPEVMEKFVEKIPSKRVGKTEEIASLVTFLVGPSAGYINGQVIGVDGGLSVGF